MIRLFGLYLMTRKEFMVRADIIEIQKVWITQLAIANAWHHADLEEERNHYSGITAKAQADFLYRQGQK